MFWTFKFREYASEKCSEQILGELDECYPQSSSECMYTRVYIDASSSPSPSSQTHLAVMAWQVKLDLRPSPVASRRRLNLSKQKRKHIGLGVSLLGLQKGFLKGNLDEDLKYEDEDRVGKDRVDNVNGTVGEDNGKGGKKGEIECRIDGA